MVNRRIVLVVDDSSANLQLFKGLLNSKYDVRLAKSGKMALAALERIHPDIVLLDIEMPDMSGFEVMSEINKNSDLQGVPVIFVTSHVSESLIYKAVKLGVKDYIIKPFAPEVLHTKVETALDVNH